MFKTRFIAIFLCLTTVFATFAGVSFAEDNVDEETIVIENGKVVSGDSTLVDEGYIVIVDDEEKSADEASGDTAEDEVTEEISEEELIVILTAAALEALDEKDKRRFRVVAFRRI